MTYGIDFDPEIRVALSHMMPTLKRHVRESLRHLSQNPYDGKPLREDLKGFMSYRVGKLRIVYSVDTTRKKVHVVTIGPREAIYEDLSRRLKPKRPF